MSSSEWFLSVPFCKLQTYVLLAWCTPTIWPWMAAPARVANTSMPIPVSWERTKFWTFLFYIGNRYQLTLCPYKSKFLLSISTISGLEKKNVGERMFLRWGSVSSWITETYCSLCLQNLQIPKLFKHFSNQSNKILSSQHSNFSLLFFIFSFCIFECLWISIHFLKLYFVPFLDGTVYRSLKLESMGQREGNRINKIPWAQSKSGHQRQSCCVCWSSFHESTGSNQILFIVILLPYIQIQTAVQSFSPFTFFKQPSF